MWQASTGHTMMCIHCWDLCSITLETLGPCVMMMRNGRMINEAPKKGECWNFTAPSLLLIGSINRNLDLLNLRISDVRTSSHTRNECHSNCSSSRNPVDFSRLRSSDWQANISIENVSSSAVICSLKSKSEQPHFARSHNGCHSRPFALMQPSCTQWQSIPGPHAASTGGIHLLDQQSLPSEVSTEE